MQTLGKRLSLAYNLSTMPTLRSPRKLTFFLLVLFGLLVEWNVLLSRREMRNSTWNYAFNVAVASLYILAFVIALWRRRTGRLPTVSRKVYLYLGLAALSWGIANLIWTYYNLILKVGVPYPSFADPFFLLSYPILGMALVSLHESYGSSANPKAIREAVVIVAVSIIVIFAFLNRPDLSPDLGLVKNLLNVAYSLGDVLLVAMALIELRAGHAKQNKGLYLLIGFLLLQAGGDFMFAYRNNSGLYWNGDVADLLFGASAFTLALALAQNNLVRHNKRN
jgi:hypothetical protein